MRTGCDTNDCAALTGMAGIGTSLSDACCLAISRAIFSPMCSKAVSRASFFFCMGGKEKRMMWKRSYFIIEPKKKDFSWF